MADIRVQNTFILDGYEYQPKLEPISYDGYVTTGFDLVLDPEEVDYELDLEPYGTVQRIEIYCRSGEVYFQLNGSADRYPINSKLVLSFAPTEIKFDNDDETNSGVLEVSIIGS